MTELSQTRPDPIPAPRSEPRLPLDFLPYDGIRAISPRTWDTMVDAPTVHRVGMCFTGARDRKTAIMASLASGLVVRQLESLFGGGSVVGLSDRQLLDRFTAQRDVAAEAAFTALVRRHGPMVLRVCGELLGDRHHAEDAFQAVFLILARKARAIRDPDLLGNWLYGVALRTSRCAKLRLAQRCRNEEAGSLVHVSSRVAVASAEQSFLAGEQAEMLQNEIGRLPRAFRLPVVLCYFEGLTVHEAARRLRCSHGTIRSRLARARDKLRRGLTRRGVILPATALAAALPPRSASASVTSHLCETTARAAIAFAAGRFAAHPASALALEVLKSMLLYKLKFLGLTTIRAARCGPWSPCSAQRRRSPLRFPGDRR
jgi:RNA polymerase sigma factor (sigma-70 family)